MRSANLEKVENNAYLRSFTPGSLEWTDCGWHQDSGLGTGLIIPSIKVAVLKSYTI